jgi:hypothetical protein
MSAVAWNDFSTEELDQLFKKLGANKSCPICDHWNWTMLPGSQGNVLLTNFEEGGIKPDGKPETAPSGHVYPALIIVCSNCGFVRHHMLGLLRQKSGRPGFEPQNPEEGNK